MPALAVLILLDGGHGPAQDGGGDAIGQGFDLGKPVDV